MDLTEEEKEKLRVSYKVAKKLDKLENYDRDRCDQSDSDDECDATEQDYQSMDSVPSDNSLPGTGTAGSGTFSPKSSEPPSLTESMQLMDEILSNTTMDRMAKIDKLEAILSAATLLPNDQVIRIRLICMGLLSLLILVWDDSFFTVIRRHNVQLQCQHDRSNQRQHSAVSEGEGSQQQGVSEVAKDETAEPFVNLLLPSFLLSRRQTKPSSRIAARLQHSVTPPPGPVNSGNHYNQPQQQQMPAKETREAGCQTLSTGDIVITKIFFKEDQDKAKGAPPSTDKLLTSAPPTNEMLKKNGTTGTADIMTTGGAHHQPQAQSA